MHCPRGAMFIFQVWGIYPHFTGQLFHRYCEDVYILIALHKLPPYLWPMPSIHYEYIHAWQPHNCALHLVKCFYSCIIHFLNIIDLFLGRIGTFLEHCTIALYLLDMCQLTWEETSLTHSCNTDTHFTVGWWDTTLYCKRPWSPEGSWVSPGSRSQSWSTETGEGNWVQYWNSYFECHKIELNCQSYLEYCDSCTY